MEEPEAEEEPEADDEPASEEEVSQDDALSDLEGFLDVTDKPESKTEEEPPETEVVPAGTDEKTGAEFGFDPEEDYDFECPECDAPIPGDAPYCPTCKTDFAYEDDEELVEAQRGVC